MVAPRDPSLPGEGAEIGLRNMAGQTGVTYQITARVIAPDEVPEVAQSSAEPDTRITLAYPDDFSQGTTSQRGPIRSFGR